MTTTRDPRTDPVAGDQLRSFNNSVIKVTKATADTVWWDSVNAGGEVRAGHTSMPLWRQYTTGYDIINDEMTNDWPHVIAWIDEDNWWGWLNDQWYLMSEHYGVSEVYPLSAHSVPTQAVPPEVQALLNQETT